nr:MAG TPA: hypothetical protein [Caudoviricetes sp.]
MGIIKIKNLILSNFFKIRHRTMIRLLTKLG